MPSTIITKNGSGAPLAADLVAGELAVDLTNGRLYTEDSGGSVIEIGLNPSGNVDVTGTVSADGLTVDGNATISGAATAGFVTPLLAKNPSTDAASSVKIGLDAGGTTWGEIGASYNTNDPYMAFFVRSGSEKVRITDAGNVGIGNDSPARLVDLKVSSETDGARLRLRSATAIDTYPTIGSVEFYSDDNSTNSSGIVGSIDVEGIGTWNGAANNAAMTFNLIQGLAGTTSPVEAMRIDSSGNVGIGGITPTGLLTLGTGTFSAAAANTSALYTSTTAGLVAVADGFLLVDRAGADVFKVDTSGNVGIGVTPSAWSTLTALQVGNAHVGALVDNAYFGANCYYDGGNWRYIATNEASRVELTSGEVQFWNAPSGTAGSVLSQTQAMTLDSSGTLLVGKTASNTNVVGTEIYSGGNAGVMGLTYAGRSLYLNRLTTDGDMIEFAKDGTTVGSIGVNSGIYTYIGTDDTTLLFAGNIDAILPRGIAGAQRDAAIDLGSSSNRFKDLYRSGSTIASSDRNMKQDERDLTEAETRVAQACKGLLKAFRFIDAVEVDGDDARIHFGIIAQDLQAAFEAEGLDATKYAMFRPSTFTDEEGNEQVRLGVCYENLLAFIIAAI